jgi:hypothetical protein
MAKSFKPKSIPSVLSPELEHREFSVSRKMEAKYLVDGVLVIVTVLIFPVISRWNTALISPILGTTSLSPATVMFWGY